MNIVSCFQLLLTLTLPAIHFSEQIKHVNESSSIGVCKGKDVHLIFKVEEEKNTISKLGWYFNNKTICSSSPIEAFTVEPPYHGRIERINKTGIQLKNVSIDDEGIYILFPLFAWSTAENRVEIKLRVLEPPTNKCTCNASTSEQTESYCGRPQVSCVWKRIKTFEVLGEENYMKSILQDKEVLRCLDGEAMKCVDDNRWFCTTVSFPHQGTDSANNTGTDTGSTSIIHTLLVFAIFNIVLLTSVIVFKMICKMRQENKDLKKNVPMMEMNSELREATNPLIKDGKRLNISQCPFATIWERIMIWFPFISSSDKSVSGQNPPKKNEQNEHLIEMNSELHEAGNPLIKDDQGLETTEAITVHQPTNYSEAEPGLEIEEVAVDQPTNDSEANSEVQALQPSTSYPGHDIKGIAVDQPMNDSEARNKVQPPTPYPRLETIAIIVHQLMKELEASNLRLETIAIIVHHLLKDLEASSKVQPPTPYPRLETIAIIVHHLLKDLEASSKVQPPTPYPDLETRFAVD